MKDMLLKQIDVFTTMPFCGNPAVVMTRASGLSSLDMQRIAAEMNILESTFVTPSNVKGARYRVRFFTPCGEYDLSGHSLIATSFALAEEGMIDLHDGVTRVKLETKAGIVPIDFHFEAADITSMHQGTGDGVPLIMCHKAGLLRRIMLQRTISEFGSVETGIDYLASILGIEPEVIGKTGLPPEIVFSGIHQLVIPVQGREALTGMCPDLIKLKSFNEKLGVQTTDVFTLDSSDSECMTYSRHFSPVMGMWEDLGSGAGAASIAAYLVRHEVIPMRPGIMEQGPENEKLSRVLVDISGRKGDSITLSVGGLAVTSMTRSIVFDDEMISVR
jgi:predicted PhzF superfamily epimerase YddE/YHI9